MSDLEGDGQQVGFRQEATLRIAQVQGRIPGIFHNETIFIKLQRQTGAGVKDNCTGAAGRLSESRLRRRTVTHGKFDWQSREPLVIVTFPLLGQVLWQVTGDLPSVEGHLQHRFRDSIRCWDWLGLFL